MLNLIRPLGFLSLAATCASALLAQPPNIPVNAPYAQSLIVATKGAHPELQKLGLHVIPPGQRDYVIVANGIPGKIGKKSSAGDIAVITSGKPTVKYIEEAKFFDLGLPVADAAGRPIGMCVMEIPYTFAKDADEALAKATAVRDELQKKIASHAQLFEGAAPLKLVQTIELPPAVKGRFDHFGVDLTHHRLFATPEDYHAVLALDLNSGKIIAEIHGIAKPHAILYRDDLDRIYITDGEAGELKIFDGKSYSLVGSVPLAKDADGIGYEPARQYLYIVNGGKNAGQRYSLVSVVDTTAGKKIADIRIEGETLEAMALDIWRPRMYVNNRTRNQVAVVDRWMNTVTAAWPVTMGKDNVAMALDEQHQRLFVGCRSGHVVVFDSNTGKELQALPIAKGVDDLEYDAASKRLYAIGNGAVDVFEESDADHFHALGSVAAGAQAKTARLVPQINRYFVAAPQAGGGRAAVQAFEPLNLQPVKPAEALAPQQVHAPWALQLGVATMSAHPDLRKMGLHAVPPGGKDSLIIANANTTRIGIKSSEGDLAAVKDGKTYCVKRDDGAFYNLKLPLQDSAGRTIGILVMEMPFTSVADEAEAIRKAEDIRRELAKQIPGYDRLFQ
jgi:DNA-binding beta-propeller fold protein YncE